MFYAETAVNGSCSLVQQEASWGIRQFQLV